VVDLSGVMADPWHLEKKVRSRSSSPSSRRSPPAFGGRQPPTVELSLERSDALTTVRMDEAANTRNVMRERLARIEQQGSDNQDMLRRILDRLK
jgi:hypothetical protein